MFGFANHLVAGISFDGAQTEFTGVFLYRRHHHRFPRVHRPRRGHRRARDQRRRFGSGISDAYYGVFIADTFNLTDRLALTASGRFNAAQINLNDQNGGDLTGNHSYQRFNPAAA